MRIVADENLPGVLEAFAHLGQVCTYPGRAIGPDEVREAQVLLVRSITRVDRRLLQGSRVRFVGSATVGTDHVDLAYLRRAGIAFAHAPGSSTQAVAEYVLAAVLKLARLSGQWPQGWTAAVIGCGRIGERVARWFEQLGLSVLRCDPPRKEAGEQGFVPLREALGAQLVTFHVPLYRARRHATWHLLNERRLRWLRPDVWLLNTSRGAVFDGRALCRWLRGHPEAHVVLDVWEGEPCVDPDLLRRVRLGTPHIAGHSLEARLRAVEALYRAACAHFGYEPTWSPEAHLPEAGQISLSSGRPLWEALADLVHAVYDPGPDDQALRAVFALPPGERCAYFDRLRRTYKPRREFSAYRVRAPEVLTKLLSFLGFRPP
ncbi:MAG: 4-phosphoerythronate dehydrogenase [Bacteroidetes bacterium]|nr:4-phosphoerythronate dehydrogenase [Rhodothermia bacterium]MCS7155740.1 4-phosphoerythronate dehydrogenase [Bacteroidota bacterium]MCX7906159.1 4-phosphoerythronate dehydrogenase [Bacteroidota bacterium]MDW8138287.1 4-phosphoerythronate dehydrogenase [Bacteroidota bacterium]MDW8285971.1 4-phosphoerythronate dehydrogenase [Bacteroidota bacterium]